MIGHLRPNRLDLTIRENRAYMASYCGLCQQLQEDYGMLGRLMVNRDALFLQLLAEAQMEEEPVVREVRCLVHPRLHRAMASRPAARYAAAISVLVAWAKLQDEINDESGLRRLGRRLTLSPFIAVLRPRVARAETILRELGFDPAPLHALLERQTELENAFADLAAASEPTAEGVGLLFAHTAAIAGKPENEGLLVKLGGAIGRAIYALDAADDFGDDQRWGRFNPLRRFHEVKTIKNSA